MIRIRGLVEDRYRVSMKRSWLLVTAVIIAVVFSAMQSATARDGYVQLEPDQQQRYRPVQTASGAVALLDNSDSFTPPAVSPDGTRVAYSALLGNESLGLYAIFLANSGGGGVSQLTTGSYGEFDPAWSPDGQTIVASQNPNGSYLLGSCCRIIRIDAGTGATSALTSNIGAVRPSVSPDGSLVVYDNPTGAWTIPIAGGTPTLRANSGFDAVFSPDGTSILYVIKSGATHFLRTVRLSSGVVSTLYSTSRTIESPQWKGGTIRFLEYSGSGYEGRSTVQTRSINTFNSSFRIDQSHSSSRIGFSSFSNDEMVFYRGDGLFRYYDIRADGSIPSPILGGSGYTTDWDSITAVDLDGDGQDEVMFYREDGLFRFYHIGSDGTLPGPLQAGSGFTNDWNSISAVDLDGDGQDELFFYRDDGLFRYYHVRSDGTLPGPLLAGSGYTTGWDAIAALDLDGDGQDEMFFYRADGMYAFYDIGSNAQIGTPIASGDDFPTGWEVVSPVDLEDDGREEIFFYRSDGVYEYRSIDSDGSLGTVLREGTDYTAGWAVIDSIELDTVPG